MQCLDSLIFEKCVLSFQDNLMVKELQFISCDITKFPETTNVRKSLFIHTRKNLFLENITVDVLDISGPCSIGKNVIYKRLNER